MYPFLRTNSAARRAVIVTRPQAEAWGEGNHPCGLGEAICES